MSRRQRHWTPGKIKKSKRRLIAALYKTDPERYRSYPEDARIIAGLDLMLMGVHPKHAF